MVTAVPCTEQCSCYDFVIQSWGSSLPPECPPDTSGSPPTELSEFEEEEEQITLLALSLGARLPEGSSPSDLLSHCRRLIHPQPQTGGACGGPALPQLVRSALSNPGVRSEGPPAHRREPHPPASFISDKRDGFYYPPCPGSSGWFRIEAAGATLAPLKYQHYYHKG